MDREDGEASPGVLGTHRGHRGTELRREGHGQKESSRYVPRAPTLTLWPLVEAVRPLDGENRCTQSLE